MKDTDVRADVEALARKLVTRLFRGDARLTSTLQRTKNGTQFMHFEWDCGGWHGTMSLDRPGLRELTSEEIGAVLFTLQAIDKS